MKLLRPTWVLLPLFGAALLSAASAPATNPAPEAPPTYLPALKPVDWKADPALTEFVKQAGTQAIDDWIKEFLSKPVPAKRLAILPFASDLDDGYFTAQARNLFASRSLGTDYSLYTRDDPEWKTLLKEIRLGDQEGDTMDKATIQRFGRVQGVQGIIKGRLTGVYIGNAPTKNSVRLADDAQVLQVRIALQAFEVETGRLIWGGEKVAGIMLPESGLFLNLTRMELLKWAAIGVGAILLLFVVLRALRSANRPR